MKRILITGSNGLLGQQLVRDLSIQGLYDVSGISASENHNTIPGFQYFCCDITRKQEVSEVFQRIQPDIVIHTAVMGSPDACENERVRAWEINVDATENIARLCALYRCHLVHLSTDFVFDGLSGPYSEEDEPNPANYYGLTKLESEKRVLDTLPASTIIRTVLVYGMHHYMARPNILTRIIQAGKNNQTLTMAADQFRTPTFLNDLSSACIKAAEIKPEGIFHISGQEMLSVYDFAINIARFFKVPEKLIQPVSSFSLNEKAKRPAKTGFIIQKAQEILDYRPHLLNPGLEIIANKYINI